MGAPPIGPIAFPAMGKMLHALIHVFGDPVPGLLPAERLQRLIADRAARQGIGRRERVLVDHLTDLVIDVVACDKEVVPCKGTGRQPGVARQNDAAFLEGDSEDVVIRERMVVEDVEAQKAHALREAAQHDVGDELHRNIVAHVKAKKSNLDADDGGWARIETENGTRHCSALIRTYLRPTKRVGGSYSKRFNLSEFDTTLTELKAIAADAYMGFRRPAAPRKG